MTLRSGDRSTALGRSTRRALIIVDLTYGFTDPSLPLGCDAQGALAATASLLDQARRHQAPRVFTRVAYHEPDRVTAAAFIEKLPALASFTPHSREATIDAAVAPTPDEPVLTKLFASGFFGTHLSSLLAAEHCEEVVVVGATTSGCVRATAVDALQHGYRVVVPEPAVADRTPTSHDAALFDIDAKYGQVVDLESALALLGGERDAIGEPV